MIICICNALNEKDLKKMTFCEYIKLKQCGKCEEDVKELVKDKRNGMEKGKS